MAEIHRNPVPEGYVKILKSEWSALGGHSNAALCRVQRNGRWVYCKQVER